MPAFGSFVRSNVKKYRLFVRLFARHFVRWMAWHACKFGSKKSICPSFLQHFVFRFSICSFYLETSDVSLLYEMPNGCLLRRQIRFLVRSSSKEFLGLRVGYVSWACSTTRRSIYGWFCRQLPSIENQSSNLALSESIYEDPKRTFLLDFHSCS